MQFAFREGHVEGNSVGDCSVSSYNECGKAANPSLMHSGIFFVVGDVVLWQ